MKVLCIDGGGIRGLIPALVLAEIERRTGRRIAEMVDLVAGTSTGGILACALTRRGADGRPLFTAEELAGIYVEEGPRIFHRSLLKRVFSAGGWIDERYEDDGLERALAALPRRRELSDALVPIFVTAYDIHDRFAFFFRSARAAHDPTYDFPLTAVARATVGRAELLRAGGGDRPRRRAHVPARSTAASTRSTRRCAPTRTSSATARRDEPAS